MPRIAPNITALESDYVNAERQVTNEINDDQIVSGRFYELGHDDFLFRTDELDISLKEIMNRIYKLELEVYELKQQLNQGGTIKL